MTEITTLSDVEQFDAALEGSHRRPVWVFKHSLLCGISTRAWNQYRDFVDRSSRAEMDCTVVEIQRARPVSAAIAERTGIRHESPQAILLSMGRPVWHASHSGITTETLAEATSRL